MFIAGCTKRSHEDEFMHPTIFDLTVDKIESRTISDNSTVWDAYITIDDIRTTDEEYPWIYISIKIWDEEKEIQLRSTADPKKFIYGADMGEEYDVWYEELSGLPNNIDVMDMIVVSGMTKELENAFVSIYYRSDIAGSIQLDSDFI
jgi:hypothetical protein